MQARASAALRQSANRTPWNPAPIARWALLGIALTVLALLVTRPWWVDRPLAFGRYLLPAVPLLLLAVSAGLVRASDALQKVTGRGEGSGVWTVAMAIPLLAAGWITSPMPEILDRPNSYTQDSYFQFDYRQELNPLRLGLPALATSPFWATLSTAPPDTLRVAVAPFRYATHEWPAAIWERDSHQRVVPAFLWGACEATRHGEVPADARFRFRNAVHVNNRERLATQGVDYRAYYLLPPGPGRSPRLPHCEMWMREHYGTADYEDAELLVWRIRPDTRLAFPAKAKP